MGNVPIRAVASGIVPVPLVAGHTAEPAPTQLHEHDDSDDTNVTTAGALNDVPVLRTVNVNVTPPTNTNLFVEVLVIRVRKSTKQKKTAHKDRKSVV